MAKNKISPQGIELNDEQLQIIEDHLFDRLKNMIDEQWNTFVKYLEFSLTKRCLREIHFIKEDQLRYEAIRKIMDFDIKSVMEKINDETVDKTTNQ